MVSTTSWLPERWRLEPGRFQSFSKESVSDVDEDYFVVMLPDDVIEPTAAMGEMIRVKKVVGMVEKPAVESAPSDVVATGRYLLGCAIFGALRHITPGKSGELQLTGAIALLISEGHPVRVVVHDGMRHDLSNPAGFFPRA